VYCIVLHVSLSACLCAYVCTWVGGCECACDCDCDYVSMFAIVFSCVRAIVLSGVFLVKPVCLWCVYENAYMVHIMVYGTNMVATERRICVLGHVCVCVCLCVCMSVS